MFYTTTESFENLIQIINNYAPKYIMLKLKYNIYCDRQWRAQGRIWGLYPIAHIFLEKLYQT